MLFEFVQGMGMNELYWEHRDFNPKLLASAAKVSNEIQQLDIGLNSEETEYLTIDLKQNLDGSSIPVTIIELRIEMKLQFDSDSFKQFLDNSSAKITILGLPYAKFFSNDHLEAVTKSLSVL
ncbi:5791_t:CDS:2 [Ambispora gerdemannii]|uniref:5791_t:CDS:1 n=1 Tax=Ambispora gerdemannii TaxID=144530 RepID=A0A9N9G1U3_9GLOM|nr:5791_t:CDS:2 [Ambispora gerdemannii]